MRAQRLEGVRGKGKGGMFSNPMFTPHACWISPSYDSEHLALGKTLTGKGKGMREGGWGYAGLALGKTLIRYQG